MNTPNQINPAPQEILDLLGGGDFIVNCMVKDVESEGPSLRMRVPSRLTRDGVSHVEVVKDNDGTFRARVFKRDEAGEFQQVRAFTGVPADALRAQFAEITGLAARPQIP